MLLKHNSATCTDIPNLFRASECNLSMLINFALESELADSFLCLGAIFKFLRVSLRQFFTIFYFTIFLLNFSFSPCYVAFKFIFRICRLASLMHSEIESSSKRHFYFISYLLARFYSLCYRTVTGNFSLILIIPWYWLYILRVYLGIV